MVPVEYVIVYASLSRGQSEKYGIYSAMTYRLFTDEKGIYVFAGARCRHKEPVALPSAIY